MWPFAMSVEFQMWLLQTWMPINLPTTISKVLVMNQNMKNFTIHSQPSFRHTSIRFRFESDPQGQSFCLVC